MNHKETGCKIVDWIRVARDRVQWRALVNTAVKNPRAPKKATGNVITSRATCAVVSHHCANSSTQTGFAFGAVM